MPVGQGSTWRFAGTIALPRTVSKYFIMKEKQAMRFIDGIRFYLR